MEDEKSINRLIETFVEYRELMLPIEQNLSNFASTYESLCDGIQKLNKSFDGDAEGKLNWIYNELSSQLERNKEMSKQIDNFKKKTDVFIEQMESFVQVFSSLESKMQSLEEIENKATSQLDKLGEIVEQKKKVYDIKDLEKNLEKYNENVQKINEYINSDIAKALDMNNEKIEQIRDKNESVYDRLCDEGKKIEDLLSAYSTSNSLLRKITEKKDVDEQYIFDIIDRWAKVRGVKLKK